MQIVTHSHRDTKKKTTKPPILIYFMLKSGKAKDHGTSWGMSKAFSEKSYL